MCQELAARLQLIKSMTAWSPSRELCTCGPNGAETRDRRGTAREVSICRRYARPGGTAWHLYRAARHIGATLIVAKECGVSDVRHSSYGSPHPDQADSPLLLEDLNTGPTPGEIIGQIGRVIAVCLGLGLLARVLIAFTGMQ
jgi:hypothetical protein